MQPIHPPQQEKSSSPRLLGILTLLLAAALTACGNLEANSAHTATRTNERFDSSLTVGVAPGAERAAVETQYGGKVVVWHPEEGFAVLGLQDTGLHVLGGKKNKAFKSPEVATSTVDGSGRTAWSGGRSS